MLKRAMDFTGSLIGLMVMAPVFLVVMIGIKLTSPGPVFYRQVRVGRHGVQFRIFKFRSMYVGSDRNGGLVTARNDSRITPLGAYLRRHKLDEFPQLINVLLGQMSLVGPRPEVPEFVAAYPRRFELILAVRPGITHRATLLFRREEEILATSDDPQAMYVETILPWKLRLYTEAMAHQSVWDDLKTIWDTVFQSHQALDSLEPPLDSPQVSNVHPFPATKGARPAMARTGDEAPRAASLGS